MIRRYEEEWRTETRSGGGYESDSGLLGLSRPERLQAISSDEMHNLLSDVRRSQERKTVEDTLAALETDVRATTEVLRRSLSKSRENMSWKTVSQTEEVNRQARTEKLTKRDGTPGDSDYARSDYEGSPMPTPKRVRGVKVLPKEPPPTPPPPKVEYRLHLHNQRVESPPSAPQPFPENRQKSIREERASVERVCEDFGISMKDGGKQRQRSMTPGTRRLLRVEGTPAPAPRGRCPGCGEEIGGACLTALAPGGGAAQKWHPACFVCNYCLKSLSALRGTFKEHQRKPYCHQCFYRLFAGTGAIA